MLMKGCSSKKELVTQDTYLTVNFGQKVYTQEGADNHAEDRLFSDKTVNPNLIIDNGIWLDNSPCPRCAKRIMNHYVDSDDKPVIYIQNVYVQQGLSSTLDSLMCLAKMINQGFKILPWDWDLFGEFLDVNSCKKLIQTALHNSAFKEKRNVVTKALDFLRAVQNTDMTNWCT